MNNCIRCNGRGHLAITGDNDTECPVCKGSGEDQDAVVSHYAQLYRYSFLLRGYLAADRHELESIRDAAWYRAGLYDALGYDRHGVSYTTVADEFGDSLFGFGRMISDGNEAAYGLKEQGR